MPEFEGPHETRPGRWLRSNIVCNAARERDLKTRLEALTQQRLSAARAAPLDDDDDDDEGQRAAGAPADEDAEREAWFLQLDLYALKARYCVQLPLALQNKGSKLLCVCCKREKIFALCFATHEGRHACRPCAIHGPVAEPAHCAGVSAWSMQCKAGWCTCWLLLKAQGFAAVPGGAAGVGATLGSCAFRQR